MGGDWVRTTLLTLSDSSGEFFTGVVVSGNVLAASALMGSVVLGSIGLVVNTKVLVLEGDLLLVGDLDGEPFLGVDFVGEVLLVGDDGTTEGIAGCAFCAFSSLGLAGTSGSFVTFTGDFRVVGTVFIVTVGEDGIVVVVLSSMFLFSGNGFSSSTSMAFSLSLTGDGAFGVVFLDTVMFCFG